ncbi:hypothetical protein JOD31_001768 [Methylopila capsulata]|uniref:Alpha/beta hydrolase n=1 Tax=Methylopila capsulata TaxID=61654 RepID=A0A9W6IQH0_9HYPH|nr:hypothetical protein [Methylopila capsulata]MBM7851543.1 hypothetical protein [Methylopila capsulata]GLK54601.1 hypothetical protein GCM10008170_06200 [Methylopila capsulata]
MLYEDDDVAVLHDVGSESGIVVVSFTPLLSKPFKRLEGFGQRAIARMGFDGLYFVAKRNHWWQVEGMAAALNAARAARRGYSRAITYGTSMGAYGALAFSRALDADGVFAMSPQLSIDAEEVPFEKRWRSHAGRLTFERSQLNEGVIKTGEIDIVYDPMNDDGQHAALVRAPARHIRIPLVGHGTPDYLSRIGLLKPMLAAAAHGQPLPTPTLRERRDQHYYWANLAKLAARRGRLPLAITLMERGYRLSGEVLGYAVILAAFYHRAGRFDDEAEVCRNLIARGVVRPAVLTRYAAALTAIARAQAKSGKPAEASMTLAPLTAELFPDDIRKEAVRRQKAFQRIPVAPAPKPAELAPNRPDPALMPRYVISVLRNWFRGGSNA